MAEEKKTNTAPEERGPEVPPAPEVPEAPPAVEQTEQGVIPGMEAPPAPSAKVIDLSSVRQEQPPGPLPLESLHHLLTVVRRPMQVGCDHPFHSVPSVFVWLHCTTKWTLEKSFVKSHTFDLTISPFRGILSQAGRKAAFPVFLPARVPVLFGGVP